MTDELSPGEIWQSGHSADLRAIQEYQESHPDIVSGIRQERGPPITYRVLIWGPRREAVEAAIRALLAHPDDVTFEPATFAPAHLRDILSEIERIATESPPGAFLSRGPTWDAVSVSLGAEHHLLAQSLHERFGDAVVLRVGSFPYPPGRPLSVTERLVASRRSPARPPREPDTVPNLVVALDVDPPRIEQSRFNANVVVTNAGAGTLQFMRGAPRVLLTKPVSGEVVGGFQGWVAAVGVGLTLGPGQSTTLRALTGTTSFCQELGYVLPPGPYLAHATLDLFPWRDSSAGTLHLRTPDVEVEIVRSQSPLA